MADTRIKLTDPNGNAFMASTPSEVSNLVYGGGYKIAGKDMSVEQAIAKLGESGPVAEQLAVQNPPVQETAAKK